MIILGKLFGNFMMNQWSETNMDIIKAFFKQELPMFTLVKQDHYGPYWWIEYSKEYIRIIFRGDIAFEVSICINGNELPLWQYDRSIVNRTQTNRENILYALEIVRNFLK